MKLSLSFDRYEGKIAVLLTDDGRQVDFPKELLPKGAKPGDMLSFSIEVDREATESLKRGTQALQDKLRKTDSGEDIKL
ncbi:MAG: DUF3006 domain-containing protein [Planctomycetota bacterium]